MKWIKHEGNEMPVSGETLVFIKCQGGEGTQNSHPASHYNWRKDLGLSTISEYAFLYQEDQNVQKDQEPQKTLRDEFAMSALTGNLANSDLNPNCSDETIAKHCYMMADAMMKARSK